MFCGYNSTSVYVTYVCVCRPENLDATFLLPSRPSTAEQSEVSSSIVHGAPSTSTDNSLSSANPNIPRHTERSNDTGTSRVEEAEAGDSINATTTFSDVVRIMVAYDMGYSTRSNGRTYDSLNGYAALIGCMSGKVIEYGTRNRKCRLCDLGHSPNDHDCRLNFQGSAKAMEADCAGELCNRSRIFEEKNMQVGVFVADDDASHIAKVREGASHHVVKLSDRNHTTRGVDRMLYGLEKSQKQLTREGVHYLHRCFTYALSQNRGDVYKMASAIRNIPNHCFNNHENCGNWCGFVRDKDNYDQSTIPGGFTDENFYLALKDIFEKLAANTCNFAHCSSSQANESLNNTMASKTPKSRCYSTSESADFRFAFSVASKNLGETYLESFFIHQDMSQAGMSPTSARTKKFLEVRQRRAECRKKLSETREFKKNRVILKQKKAALRKKIQRHELDMYESGMGLLSQPALESTNNNVYGFNIVYYDIETSSLARNCDILQIAARSGDATFESFINPVQKVSPAASKVNNLTNVDGELHRHGVRVPSIPIRVALGNFHQFLCSIGGKCVPVAHNGNVFDSIQLVHWIRSCSLLDEFQDVIHAFSDTLPIFRKKLARKNNCSQTRLAAEFLNVDDSNAHDAAKDVEVLQKLSTHFELGFEQLMSSSSTLQEVMRKQAKATATASTTGTLLPLKDCISAATIVKLATTGVTFDALVEAYVSDKQHGISNLFTEEVDGSTRVTKSSKVIKKTQRFFEMYFDIMES